MPENYTLDVEETVRIAQSVKIIADSKAVIKIGAGSDIRENVILESVSGGVIEIGSGSVIGYGSWIQGTGGVYIGNKVLIGPSVAIASTTHRHDLNISIASQGIRTAVVNIEDDVWIGANVTITAGTSIGEG